MTWQAYRLVYRLKSNLHVGWRKVGNLMQTRPYIPGRSWWGAATSLLTQSLGAYAYSEVGKLVRDNLIFSYFFLATEPDTPLLPHWKGKKGGVDYGDMSEANFEQRFLRSQAATAIDTQSNTSLEGQLYEVEYIAPRVDENTDVVVVGYLFAQANDRITCEPEEVFVDGLPLFNQVLQQVQIGGERRYGFGTLERKQVGQTQEVFSYPWTEDTLPVLTIPQENPLPAHLLVEGGPDMQGALEPLMGREWCQKSGPGNHLSAAQVCWSPGSCVGHEIRVKVQPMGVLHSF